ncbi:MAG: hypothetical protein NC339_00370 [Muribaculaceae bacterium]|nr:hypothetical protein [Muribaculaceae bacterium]
MSELKEKIGSIWIEIQETIKLNIDYAKLTGAEKLTALLSACVVGLITIILVSAVIFLISIAIIVLISNATGVFGACMIVAGIYALLLILLFAFRRKLVVDPIAKFISLLILK